jgi:outer membrane protein TolC
VSKARIEAGVLAPIEILVSEAEIASRETGILDAEKDIGDFDDQLKAAMNYERWDVLFLPVDTPRPFGDPPDVNKEITEALELRRDYKQALLKKDNKEICVNYAKNQTLPNFSLIGSVGLNGLRKSYYDTINDTAKGDYYSWGTGFLFQIPLGNKKAKSKLIKERAEDRKASEQINKVKQNIIVEVRKAVRAVRVSLKKINATIKSEALAKKRYENEQEKFKVGMSTAHDVLDFQESYAQKLSDKDTAVVEYAKALADLKLVKKVGKKRINQGIGAGQETLVETCIELPQTQGLSERESQQLFNR